MPRTNTSSSWYAKHEKEKLLFLRLEQLQFLNEKEKADQFMYQHIQLPLFREQAILRNMDKSNWKEALRLCEDGERMNQKGTDLVDKWMAFRLQVYERLNNKNGKKQLMFHFLYQGAMVFIRDTSEEWPAISEKIIDGFERQGYLSHAYVKILIDERKYDKLLNYCQNRPSTIEDQYNISWSPILIMSARFLKPIWKTRHNRAAIEDNIGTFAVK